jgi:hypothetical protein
MLFRFCYGWFCETIKFLFRVLNQNKVEPNKQKQGEIKINKAKKTNQVETK